jgi:hypothetical protein
MKKPDLRPSCLGSERFGECYPDWLNRCRVVAIALVGELSLLNSHGRVSNPLEIGDDDTALSNISPHPSSRPIFFAIQMDADTRGKFLSVDLILTGP